MGQIVSLSNVVDIDNTVPSLFVLFVDGNDHLTHVRIRKS